MTRIKTGECKFVDKNDDISFTKTVILQTVPFNFGIYEQLQSFLKNILKLMLIQIYWTNLKPLVHFQDLAHYSELNNFVEFFNFWEQVKHTYFSIKNQGALVQFTKALLIIICPLINFHAIFMKTNGTYAVLNLIYFFAKHNYAMQIFLTFLFILFTCSSITIKQIFLYTFSMIITILLNSSW